jgi:hypothetical protein
VSWRLLAPKVPVGELVDALGGQVHDLAGVADRHVGVEDADDQSSCVLGDHRSRKV